jgi:hypothetical protein
MSLFDELDLGAEDYSPEKSSGLGQFTSKPSPRKIQYIKIFAAKNSYLFTKALEALAITMMTKN